MNIDEKKLAGIIDECIKNGSMHISVKTGNETIIEECKVSCKEGGACSSPTIYESIDEYE